jgi:membrane associated rhomboid family serine protease
MLIPYKDMNPTRRYPAVTVIIIAANVAVYVYVNLLGGVGGHGYEAYLAQFGLIPSRFFSRELFRISSHAPAIITPFTAMFLHGGILHLAGNMLYMWIFGNNVEDYLGHFKFIVFYIVCGLAASFLFMFISPLSHAPMIGASGAISGVMGAYFVLWPRARIKSFLILIIFVTVVEIPAVVVLGFWIVIQVLEGFSSIGRATGIAWFAHIGGFFMGMGLILSSGNRKKK